MDMDRMHIKPFQLEEIGATARPRNNRPASPLSFASRGRGRLSKKVKRLPVSLLVKVGICVVACGLMLALKDLDVPVAAQMVSGVKSAVNEETDLTEMLGKLQFVELPNTLEVFSSGNKMVAPVSAPYVSLEAEEQYAKWEGAPNAEVVASASGEVRAIGEDEMLGKYVRLTHDGELETIYYGLQTVQVEEGQPIRRQDTLGTLGESGTLRLRVLYQGKPQAPDDYLDLVLGG